ncbi:MAG TPA: T9SS type A sorting domain-containing protein, partial [Candidatus Cloacimonadota bacterium]|nr:T9SS type A sorting domain-containing protein [Candidatus Cloacimonadota bacterium]
GYDLNISIGTHGTAVFNFVVSSPNIGEYKIPIVLSTVLANDDATVSEVLKVSGSYPNPFQDQLSFEIDSAKHYQSNLDIFNVKGQKVQTIALPNLVQGSNSVSWDATDLPNGVYFYRLEGSASTGKILKVK